MNSNCKIKVLRLCLLSAFISVCLTSIGQDKILKISSLGIDSVKIGFSKKEVENVIGGTLENYYHIDTLEKAPFSFFNESVFNETYIGKYHGIELVFTFHHGLLEGITSPGKSKWIETKSGIKAGITINEFEKICLINDYDYSFLTTRKGCFFSEAKNRTSHGALMFVKFDNSLVSRICTIQIEHD